MLVIFSPVLHNHLQQLVALNNDKLMCFRVRAINDERITDQTNHRTIISFKALLLGLHSANWKLLFIKRAKRTAGFLKVLKF